MTEKVLTDDEKSALLSGVRSGDVEVQTSVGRTYASVAPFEIGARARIIRNSYPRLQLMNQQAAEKLGKYTERLLQCDVGVVSGEISVHSFGEFTEQLAGPSVVVVFEASPLEGKAALVMEPAMVTGLVNAFFGGAGENTDSRTGGSFTAGEMGVSKQFANVVLASLKEAWAPLMDISPAQTGAENNMDLVDIASHNAAVIGVDFEISLAGRLSRFRVLWPLKMVAPLVPAFDGQKRDRDLAEDSRWKDAIRRLVADSVLRLTSSVGCAQLPLGQLVNLAPGDVIEIDNPQDTTVMAKHVPLIHGRLGVHRGRNAVETVEWLDQQQNT